MKLWLWFIQITVKEKLKQNIKKKKNCYCGKTSHFSLSLFMRSCDFFVLCHIDKYTLCAFDTFVGDFLDPKSGHASICGEFSLDEPTLSCVKWCWCTRQCWASPCLTDCDQPWRWPTDFECKLVSRQELITFGVNCVTFTGSGNAELMYCFCFYLWGSWTFKGPVTTVFFWSRPHSMFLI